MINLIFQRNDKSYALLLTRSTSMPLNHSSPVTDIHWLEYTLNGMLVHHRTPHTLIHACHNNKSHRDLRSLVHWEHLLHSSSWLYSSMYKSRRQLVQTVSERFEHLVLMRWPTHPDKGHAIIIQMIVTGYVRQLQILMLLVWHISNDVSINVSVTMAVTVSRPSHHFQECHVS